MERILRYLREQETDSTGEAWTLISRITADLAFTREQVYAELMKVEDEGLIKVIKTLEPGPCARAHPSSLARSQEHFQHLPACFLECLYVSVLALDLLLERGGDGWMCVVLGLRMGL